MLWHQYAKVTVWCGIRSTVDLGFYFFEKATLAGIVTCFITASRYTAMLENYVIPNLLQRNAGNDFA